MVPEPGALKFGLYLALVGISITFGSLLFLYLILILFSRMERWFSQKNGHLVSEDEPLDEELIAVIGVALEKYLAEERAYISGPSEIRLKFRKPSSWKISGRSED